MLEDVPGHELDGPGLRSLRLTLRMSRVDLARELGIHRGSIRRWESGKRLVRPPSRTATSM
ncbi:MAG: helix-turn-helix domain-containing protein [Nitrospira sp.]